jgi:hypothetical protein
MLVPLLLGGVRGGFLRKIVNMKITNYGRHINNLINTFITKLDLTQIK